ncbi:MULTISPECIES: polysaccharide pyruvyl transferase family protein [Rhodococcus]|uniref:Polysaccharide pyruvyl transferase family protein n=1 Tax=Rhodococcus oxybenzonivorans TaxID=1990687 RepID=A0AAE5A4W5_9NOCA|nr:MULTISPECIES: polysaccharide pyruvyl transferase family protein [Rhodococcus]MDV7245517.1 polysaccharide pyruvyl transferase family protein [Rhodococcus oxybenzonivorans]MDV7263318.1 polysaccharide pyruvyl transferase family protein [Rhodococcus oxybenzonivorans]MDV7276597.1 polysaccharide pyruvyl transferase family protein [Rhodococcus oxybenzonivorans]MDV7336476.1 polysaccharide pyruvyl transferase family protein [Rhodococcus oxybenzonivorans]MDV7346807.1 polysaccharide pyruvyl transferas
MNDPLDDLQRATIAALAPTVQHGQSVALLDYPAHFNAGDLLIYQGTLSYLARMGASVDYVCALHTYDTKVLSACVPEGPLLLNGGGNFGDRWFGYQKFRERVIAEHPERKIVQMPQTIEFHDDAALARAQRIYAQHPDLTLLMRDRRGYELARELFPENTVVFCADAALGVGRIAPSAEPTRDIVLLKRRDPESVQSAKSLPASLASAYMTDWHVSAADNAQWWPTTLGLLLLNKLPGVRSRMYPLTRRAFDWQADMVVDNAVAILSQGRLVVTDRLHAGILAVLMGKPVVLVDNANKKVSRIHGDYLSSFPDTHLAENFDHAAELAGQLVS